MTKFTSSKRIGMVAIMLTLFYGMFAFFVRASLASAADHLKVVLFSCVVSGWMLLWFCIGDRLGRKSVGLRVTAAFVAGIVITLVMAWLRDSFGEDPVWRELWDTTPVVFLLPVIQSMFLRSNEKGNA